jgi:hypothetical protein
MPRLYVAEFVTNGTGVTGSIPAPPWTAASFPPGTNPNFYFLHTPVIPFGPKPLDFHGNCDTIAFACDAGQVCQIQGSVKGGPINVTSTPQVLTTPNSWRS